MQSQSWSGDGLVSGGVEAEYPLSDLEPGELLSACKVKKGGAAGADGMTPELLGALSLGAWSSIAQWLNNVERGEARPCAITWTGVAPLLKNPEDTPPIPGKTRLISVEAVLGRVWASVRCRQLAPWLLSCVGDGVIGGVMGRSCEDATTKKELMRTAADGAGVPFGELGFDCSHCFDSLDAQVLVAIARNRGLPARVADPLLRLLAQGTRCVVWKGWVSDPLGGNRGLPQGNALSVLLAVLWSAAWEAQAKSIVSSAAFVSSYLDDLSISSVEEGDLRRVLGMTTAYLNSWDVVMNAAKSVLALNTPVKRVWHWGFEGLKDVCCWDILGVPLGYNKCSSKAKARLTKASFRLQRLQSWPGSFAEKCRLVATMISGLYYGLCFELSQRNPLLGFSASVWEILWGRRRFSASRPLGWALVMPKQVCPFSCWWISASMHVRKIASSDSGRTLLLQVWDRGLSEYPGLWGVFSSVLRDLNLSCQSGGRVVWGNKILLDLDMPRAQWAHQSRWIMRAWWVKKSGRSLAQAFGLDYKSTDRLVGKVGRDGLDSARTLALQAFLTRGLQHSHFGDVTPWCEHCKAFDSQYHRLWECPRLARVRQTAGLSREMRT